MAKEDISNERIIPNLLKMKHEYLFKTIGKDGKYSLELKCLFLILILYIPGLITTILSGTWEIYVFEGWRHFVSTVFIGIIVWFLIRFLGRIDEEIRHVNQTIGSPKKEKPTKKEKEERKKWERKIEKYREWVGRLESYKGYYFQAVLGAVCLFILSMFIIDPQVGWVDGKIFNELYLRAWYTFLGFLAGACFSYIGGGFWAIRKYCKDVVSHEEILPLDPDHTGGLRELGRLSLDLDLIVALPSIAFPIYLLGREPEFWVQANLDFWIGISILYALLLIVVFFVSISPAHDDMVTAKTECLLKIHREYRDMHKRILQKLEDEKLVDPKQYDRMSGLYNLYDRVESMAVWPLDFRTALRFAITSSAPLISVAITISLPV